MIETPTRSEPDTDPTREALNTEALIREARRLQRRHQAKRLLIASAAAALLAGLILWLTGPGQGTSEPVSPERLALVGSGTVVGLKLAGPLAVASNGLLYVADVASNRVLRRLADGRFRDVAGDGRAGFSGDGGPADQARLSDISDLAFAPDGRLFIADGGRVRVVDANGTIRTIVGDGHSTQDHIIASGTRALSARLGSEESITRAGTPLSIAFSPQGQLYISTGTQILRLTADNRLVAIKPQITSGLLRGRPFIGAGPIAVTRDGSIYEGGEVLGWSIWEIRPSGLAHEVGYARGSGGNNAVIQRGPDGVIYSEDGPTIDRVASHQLTTVFPFGQRIHGQYFPTRYFALAGNGTLYADDLPGNQGFEAHQQLVKVGDHKIGLLWQQPK